MALTGGTRLGPYEIQSPLGAGGMGEVYRALDTRLQRIVAVKILPSHLSENPEAKERLDREARTISSLNHPNICTLYDVGHQDGFDYLVMEYPSAGNISRLPMISPPGWIQTITGRRSSPASRYTSGLIAMLSTLL
jgi:serine/threonine protein kinase